MIKRLLVAIGLAAVAGVVGAAAATPVRPHLRASPDISPFKRLAELKKHPLIFYVAKGSPDACGDGCDTWIAAEGHFDRGAFNRLQRFLKRLGHRKLPIYFHSTGGLADPALEIGRLLRKENMTAGVAITVPHGCPTEKAKGDDCRKLKESNRDVPADLREADAICASACVFALIGASTRLVPPTIRLGVHRPLSIIHLSNGHTIVGSREGERRALDKWKRYVAAMGIDGRFMTALTSANFQQSRILTRNEIADFKIDTRFFSETRWKVMRQKGGKTFAYKFIVQSDAGKLEYVERAFIVGCASWPGTLLFRYTRELPLVLTEDIDTVRIDAGGRSIMLGQHLAVLVRAKEIRDGFLEVSRFS